MSHSKALTAIEKRFRDAWANTTAIRMENEAWADPKAISKFVALNVLEGGAFNPSTGSKRKLVRYNGTIILQVFVKAGDGVGDTPVLIDLFTQIYAMQEFSIPGSGIIRCQVPDKVPIGERNGWYQTNSRCRYQRDEFIVMS